MKKTALCLLISVIVSVCLFVSAYSQEDMVIVDSSAFEKPQRVPSVFEHDAHNELAGIEECSQCHHVYEEGKLVEDESSEDQSCADCHELEASGRKPGLMMAFHTNCKGCHLEKKKGPITCGECHKK